MFLSLGHEKNVICSKLVNNPFNQTKSNQPPNVCVNDVDRVLRLLIYNTSLIRRRVQENFGSPCRTACAPVYNTYFMYEEKSKN